MSTTPNPQLSTDPFEGLGGVKATDVSPESQFLKIAIMGPPKSGKSLFAVTMPGSKRVYDFDDRKVSIAGTPNCNIITLKDGISQPFSVQTVETELSTFKYRKIKGLPIPDVFIFDTVSNWIDNGIKFAYLKENPK